MPNNSARKDEIAKHFAEFMWYHLARTQTSMHVPTRAALEQALTSYEEERGEGWQQRIAAAIRAVTREAAGAQRIKVEADPLYGIKAHERWYPKATLVDTDALMELYEAWNAKDATPPASLSEVRPLIFDPEHYPEDAAVQRAVEAEKEQE
jgi:uncharacterized protein (DUF4415 family)